jgi:hypothetical protein
MRHRRPLYVWHVPKTAGTSLWTWLAPHYPDEATYREGLIPALVRDAATGALHGKQLFCGHFADAPLDLLRPRPTTVTVIREPVQRSLSHLEEVARSPRHPQHDRVNARRGNLDGVLADPILRRMLHDFQCRYLAVHHVPDRLPETEDVWSVPRDSPLRTQMAFEMSPLPDRKRLVLRALRRLATLDHVGVTDRLDVLMREVARAQGWPAPTAAAARANTTGQPAFPPGAVTGAQRSALQQLCRGDVVLYRAAQFRSAAVGVAPFSAQRSSAPDQAHVEAGTSNPPGR